MHSRERWQALQTQLARAQERLTAGDHAAALEAVDAALTLDPNFLAAHALRDRIVAGTSMLGKTPAQTPARVRTQVRPLVSPEGYAQFEQRARRRRVDRRVDAARAALANGQSKEAAAAIDEVRELDPNLPELQELVLAFETLRAGGTRSNAGRWLAAAAAFGAVMIGASWLQETNMIGSRSVVSVAPLVAPPRPASSVASAEPSPPQPELIEATTGELAGIAPPIEMNETPEPKPIAVPPPSSSAPAPPPPTTPSPSPSPAATPAVALAGLSSSSSAPVAPDTAPGPAPPVAPAINAPAPLPPVVEVAPPPPAPVTPPTRANATVPGPGDEALVQQALQRYRTAYEGLDAQSARAVWPGVNQSALARAFDGLESQSLTFDACDVMLRGESASAVCRGTARYVPKIGSREEHVEPRKWNFTLRKSGSAWTIESARTER